MPRIRLEARPEYCFKAVMTVRTTDLNYGGHLGNDRLLALVHEARVSFLASFEWSEMNCAGVSLIMSDTAIIFQNEAFAGDQLVFEVSMGEATRVGFRIFNRIRLSSDNKDIALVENGMVCFDYEQRKVCSLPQAVLDLCHNTK